MLIEFFISANHEFSQLHCLSDINVFLNVKFVGEQHIKV